MGTFLKVRKRWGTGSDPHVTFEHHPRHLLATGGVVPRDREVHRSVAQSSPRSGLIREMTRQSADLL